MGWQSRTLSAALFALWSFAVPEANAQRLWNVGEVARELSLPVSDPGNCRPSSGAMCLQRSRYEVTVDWWTADGRSGTGQVAGVGTADSGLFWFFGPNNWELLVKVLDACGVNGHHWVFGAATTDLGYRVRVRDTESGRVREYLNEPGQAAQAIADVTAFPEGCAAAGSASASRARALGEPLPPFKAFGPPAPLRPSESPAPPGSSAFLGASQTGDPNLVLQKGRFDVRVQWTTEDGETGPGSAAPERTADSGLFWFFEPSNWEMLVKVLDGCALNDHYWVLAGSATTLGFEIVVTDTQTDTERRYAKTDVRERAAALVDSSAFPCSASDEDGDSGEDGDGVRAIASLSVTPGLLRPAQAGKQGADTIMVTARDAGGSPVPAASFRWSTDRHSGWAWPPRGVADEEGRFETTWVAGWPGEGALALTVENEISQVTETLSTRSTVPANAPNGALAVWIYNKRRPSSGYSIDMTPLTEPPGTYYAAIQWDGGYTGLQRQGSRYDRQLQFSVWDAPGHGDAELIDRANDVQCLTFGGEGTGVKCELEYPWTVGSTYRFQVTEEEMNGGSAITLHVTDLAAGHRRFVGTIRFARRARLDRFAMFVEDFLTRIEHCLDRAVMSAAIRRPRAWIDGTWVVLDEMRRARLSKWHEDPWNPGTPGCANIASRNHAAGLQLAIGGQTASDPNGPIVFAVPMD